MLYHAPTLLKDYECYECAYIPTRWKEVKSGFFSKYYNWWLCRICVVWEPK